MGNIIDTVKNFLSGAATESDLSAAVNEASPPPVEAHVAAAQHSARFSSLIAENTERVTKC